MFDPRMLQDPILMALLSQLGQQQQQPTGGMGAQSNPNIFQDPSGVYRNIQPSNEPPALPVAAPGDYATEQYLAQLAAEQAARQAQIAEEMKRRDAELAHSRATELEGLKQTGSTEREGMKGTVEIQKQLLASAGTILNNEMATPEQKMTQLQQLISAAQLPTRQQPAKAEESPATRPVMEAGPAVNLKDPQTQVTQLQQLLDRYTKGAAPKKPTIGTPDPRFTQTSAKDPALAADIARRIFLFGRSNNIDPKQIVLETKNDPRIPDEIKTLVEYYAAQYATGQV